VQVVHETWGGHDLIVAGRPPFDDGAARRRIEVAADLRWPPD
jgi:hypothetical protein